MRAPGANAAVVRVGSRQFAAGVRVAVVELARRCSGSVASMARRRPSARCAVFDARPTTCATAPCTAPRDALARGTCRISVAPHREREQEQEFFRALPASLHPHSWGGSQFPTADRGLAASRRRAESKCAIHTFNRDGDCASALCSHRRARRPAARRKQGQSWAPRAEVTAGASKAGSFDTQTAPVCAASRARNEGDADLWHARGCFRGVKS